MRAADHSTRDATTATIRQAVDLVALVEEIAGREFRKTGGEWRGPCPIHAGDGPNFAVNPTKGVYHCHTCGAEGDAFTLVQWAHHVDFPQARAFLAQRAGIALEDDAVPPAHPRAYQMPAPRPVRANTAETTAATWSAATADARLTAATEWRRRTLAEGGTWQEPPTIYTALRDALPLAGDAADYLARRGLDPAQCYALGVRSVASWPHLGVLLDEIAVDAWEAVYAGLHLAPRYYLPDERTETPRAGAFTSPAFAAANLPALAFFYAGPAGDAVGLRFRTIATDAQLEAARLTPPTRWRYLSPRGNAPAVPWGVDALWGITGRDLHVAEGEPDAIALRLYGVRSIGIPGAALVPGGERSPWLRATGNARRVLLWFDPDQAGDKGAPRLRDRLQAANGWSAAETRRRVLRVPIKADTAGGKVDVNTIHQQAPAELRRYLDSLSTVAA